MKNILRVKEILKEKGKSLNDLANDMSINRVTLSNMINGNPTLETLNKIALHLEVETKDLFHSVSKENYTITKNEHHNIYIYDDEYIWMQGNLPHFTNHDYGTFKIDIKRKDFSIVPDSKLVDKLVESDESVEEFVFMGNYKNDIMIQLFSCFTSLSGEEYSSFCNALRTYIHYHKLCYDDIVNLLEVNNYKRVKDSNRFELCTVELDTWEKLVELTYEYDLDSNKNDFENFNATGKSIIMYNLDIEKGYNIKTWITSELNGFNNNEVLLYWHSPKGFERNKILANDIFTAKESYDFLFDKMIPRANSLKKKKSRTSIF